LRTINWERPEISGARGFSARARKTAPGAGALPNQLRSRAQTPPSTVANESGMTWNWRWKSLQKPVAAVCDRRRGVENQREHGGHRPPLQQKWLSKDFAMELTTVAGKENYRTWRGLLQVRWRRFLRQGRRGWLWPGCQPTGGRSKEANSAILLTDPFIQTSFVSVSPGLRDEHRHGQTHFVLGAKGKVIVNCLLWPLDELHLLAHLGRYRCGSPQVN